MYADGYGYTAIADRLNSLGYEPKRGGMFGKNSLGSILDNEKYTGVNDTIPFEIQLFLWEAVDNMPAPKDYLQVFNLSIENGLQVIHHTSEQPEFDMTYILTTVNTDITEKIYIIDDGEQCTMLLAEEY